jgi:hypothetical protein
LIELWWTWSSVAKSWLWLTKCSWYQFGPCCNSDLTLEAAFFGKQHCFTWWPDLNCIVLYRNKLLLIYYFHFHISNR